MKISVIISTYNNPAALQKVLWGYRCQTDRDFEIVIADDGSTDETRQLVQRQQADFPSGLQHVWHEDAGFRKNKILNRAIVAAAGDYLILTDGDCVPRDDFVRAHRQASRANYFLSGGSHIDIPQSIHETLSEDDVATQRLFTFGWLRSGGLSRNEYRRRLTRNPRWAQILDRLTPRPGVLIGCNSSVWKRDVMQVNGFDESLSTYGSEDKDLGIRLTNNGVRSRRLKYSLVCVHLSHPRNYVDPQQVESNKRSLQTTRARRITWTQDGIEKRQAMPMANVPRVA